MIRSLIHQRILSEGGLRSETRPLIQRGLNAGTVPSWTLTKTAANGWSNAGASSVQTIAGDGWVEFRMDALSGNQFMIGLSASDIDQSYASNQYAIFIKAGGGTIDVYESPDRVTPVIRLSMHAVVGDETFKIQRVGTTITYLKNDVIIYTSATAISVPLLVDVALHSPATVVQNIKLYDNGIQVPITWQNVVGCTATEVP